VTVILIVHIVVSGVAFDYTRIYETMAMCEAARDAIIARHHEARCEWREDVNEYIGNQTEVNHVDSTCISDRDRDRLRDRRRDGPAVRRADGQRAGRDVSGRA